MQVVGKICKFLEGINSWNWLHLLNQKALAITAVRMSASKESRDFTNYAVAGYAGIGNLLPHSVCTIA